MAKMRNSVKNLETGGVSSLRGVGAMEIAEGRGFIVGVIDGLRKIGSSREVVGQEIEEEEDGFGEESDSEMAFA